ncbi:tetratricopeptide repeat family protein [Paraburkholderia xenovorans LB400]|jgi:Flp pilus assembly protein TadD|uniref:TPR domain protein n=1 Tax=Paraburkholderia xenovorans (strain LB400) TaxID=266265 RepID=Q145N0_PARXL|nr:tetratricopeptide repeat-containing glycosyltransferase family protein [Paraburkholderia xenovorans]ABE28959.1 TPR domain protein [Paraburkholderia xenovorans LB400]AIP31947.1 tetratricopeptide repeat family protein [Paraburkholderia xenovorans LB400]
MLTHPDTYSPTMPTFPSSPAADHSSLHDEAVQAYQAGRHDAVRTLAERILAEDPEHVGAIHLQGLLALASGHAREALRSLERAIQIRPEPILFNTLYAIRLNLGDFAGAVQSIRQGLAIQPDFAAFHYNLALTLQHLGHIEDAALGYRRTLELDPDNSAAHNNLGRVCADLGAMEEAGRHYRRAIELSPANLVARNNLGMALLATGRYDEAWPYFEDRWVSFKHTDGRPAPAPVEVPLPRWPGAGVSVGQGAQAVQSLLVLHEQGLGDSLQFVRYLPLALAHFARVGYVCPPALRRLYEQSLCSRWPGLVLLDAIPADLAGWDRYIPLMSLPMAFATRVATIPAALPYLYGDAGQAAAWRARLDALPAPHLPRVGVVWAGGHSGIAVDRLRSLAAVQIAPLLALPHVRWISLQKTDDPAKLADAVTRTHLTDWTDEIGDFADTAALIENLDLVISVDTSVAHLAAAMGKPVWLLNRFAGCWRWLYGRDDSAWYPGLRLFTQTRRADWHDVLERVVVALTQTFPMHDNAHSLLPSVPVERP